MPLASARLNHPNIIVVHDYGRAGAEGAYLVMELGAGTTLRDTLKSSGPLLPTAAAAHFEQILAGLKAAHDAGVIHRDPKPENVLIAETEDGRAIIKLLDFGLAKLRALDAADSGSPTIPGGLTTPGTVMGTFGYMSPEQLQGEEVDERADIFAVGVMVVESLTGRRPFEGKSYAELLTTVLHQTFTLPGDAPAVRRLDAVLRKCLAKERTSRYATVIELQGALIPSLKGCPQLSSLRTR
jgi:serine/threonine protein kinase